MNCKIKKIINYIGAMYHTQDLQLLRRRQIDWAYKKQQQTHRHPTGRECLLSFLLSLSQIQSALAPEVVRATETGIFCLIVATAILGGGAGSRFSPCHRSWWPTGPSTRGPVPWPTTAAAMAPTPISTPGPRPLSRTPILHLTVQPLIPMQRGHTKHAPTHSNAESSNV